MTWLKWKLHHSVDHINIIHVMFLHLGQSRATVLGNHLDVFYQLMQFSQTLVKNSDVVVLHKEMSDSVKSEWTKMLETVQKINKKRQTDDKIGENHAFELLFLHVGLQLFTEPEGAIESLQVSLSCCFQKLF